MKKTIFILFLLSSAIIHAQTLKISVDRNPAIVGEQILLQYTINTYINYLFIIIYGFYCYVN